MYDIKYGDCLEIMKSIPNKSVDMILTDLPYGLSKKPKDVTINLELLWKQYERIIKDNAAIALFAQGLFYIDLVNSNRKLFRYDIIWDKELTTGFLNANRAPLRSHEQIAIFYKKQPQYYPQFQENPNQPLHSKGKKFLEKIPKNQNYGKYNITDDSRAGETIKYPKSIWKFKKPHPSVSKHATEKSIPLLEELIKTYTKEDDLILDSCMGSATTGIACINTRRNFIGIEIDKEYFDISTKRLEELNKKASKI